MGSLADCVLADTILIHPRPPILLTTIKKVRGFQKKVRKLEKKNHLLVNEKRSCRDG